MRVSRDERFDPITLTIEDEHELRCLLMVLRKAIYVYGEGTDEYTFSVPIAKQLAEMEQ